MSVVSRTSRSRASGMDTTSARRSRTDSTLVKRSGLTTVSSEELAARGGTTSAQVRKDLSFFGSFGKRGLGYQVAELTQRMRRILGLERDWRVVIIGVGKIGAALAQYEGFQQRGFR